MSKNFPFKKEEKQKIIFVTKIFKKRFQNQ